MADQPKPPLQPRAAGTQPQPKPPVVEREPLTITVVEPATAEQAVRQPVRVEAPPRTEAWRPSNLGLLFLVGGVLLFTLYRLQFAPLILRWEHGLQRRVFGEREYDARQEPAANGPHQVHEKHR